MCLHRKITLRKSGVKISNPFVIKKTVTGSMPTLQCFSTSLTVLEATYWGQIYYFYLYTACSREVVARGRHHSWLIG